MEKTLIILKPDCLERELVTICVDRLTKLGSIRKMKYCNVKSSSILNHYSENLKDHPQKISNRVLNYFVNKSIIIFILEGEEIISKTREIIGASDPSKAIKGTLRGDFGNDSYEKAIEEKRSCYNLIHSSDSLESFNREYRVWFE